MLSVFLTTYIHICILTIPLLFYLKPRYTLLAITAVYILCIQQHQPEQTGLYYQISALLAILLCLKHNRRYTGASILWLMFLSFGILLSGLLTDNKMFITQAVQYINKTLLPAKHLNNEIVINILHKTALWMLIGLLPFNKHIMHLFTMSNNFFKTTCFIIPMFLLQLIIQQDNNITTLLFGYIICLHSGIHCIFENKIRYLLVYVITYFYGLNIITTAQNHNNTNIFNAVWLILCIAVLAYTKIIAPRKTQTHFINDIKAIIGDTKIHIVLSVWFYTLLVLILLLYYQTNNTQLSVYNWLCLSIMTPPIILTGKIVYILLFTNNKYNHINIWFNKKIESVKTTILFVFITMCVMYVFLHQTIPHHINLTTHIVYRLTFVLIVFIISLFLSKILIITKKTKLLKGIRYNNHIQKILDGMKVVVDIIYISITDFVKVVNNNTRTTLSSSSPSKLTNLLNNNQMYFYIFFLIEIIVVLTIECVIT